VDQENMALSFAPEPGFDVAVFGTCPISLERNRGAKPVWSLFSRTIAEDGKKTMYPKGGTTDR